MRKCVECGVDYEEKKENQKFCSYQCKCAYWNRKKNKIGSLLAHMTEEELKYTINLAQSMLGSK